MDRVGAHVPSGDRVERRSPLPVAIAGGVDPQHLDRVPGTVRDARAVLVSVSQVENRVVPFSWRSIQ